MSVNRWWERGTGEIYWLETTDRADLGANLKAPKYDDANRDNWRYTLLREMRPGDVVFHYSNTRRAIVGRSVVSSASKDQEILWGARGTVARKNNVQPYPREGLLVELRNFETLPNPLSLETLNARVDDLRRLLSDLKAQFDGATYFPFELSSKRPVRTLQGYAFKLPRSFVVKFLGEQASVEPIEEIAHAATDHAESDRERRAVRSKVLGVNGRAGAETIGESYTNQGKVVRAQERVPFEVDPDNVDRGNQAHASTQDALADFLRSAGVAPLRPAPGDPEFDLAWRVGAVLYVAEVKSITPANEEKQLRLGLGQVLRYRQLLGELGAAVEAVVVAEVEPSDVRWGQLCESLGVTLVWPGKFERLTIDRQAPTRAGLQPGSLRGTTEPT